jgi:alanyl-tRNA synthetase
LLLTSAGMVQFKPYFLQQKQLEAPYIGTTTVQKCVRTTDIDIIGTTGRHLSFFEMLGNFSFGEYFKEEMCAWAYEFSTEVLGFDPERLYFTVYLDDDETVDIWRSLGVPDSHITRLGEEDNFWTAGPTGPCGPCSELYYDQGPQHGCGKPGCAPGCDCDRFLEYWNCVFTQYDRQEDGTLKPLPKKNIDTGMGLERTAAILQGVQSNYETDILRGLIAVGEKLSGKRYNGAPSPAEAPHAPTPALDPSSAKPSSPASTDLSLRIVADHARAVAFMIADGILPSNEGRGYVLRRLLRRAVRHGQLLGIEPPFLGAYLTAVIDEMAGPYPELRENQRLIERIVHAEEERFNQTLRQGQVYLDQHLDALLDKTAPTAPTAPTLSGKAAFELHDRYGFPIDLTVEIAGEQGIGVDREGFEAHMDNQRTRARAHAKGGAWVQGDVWLDILNQSGPTAFAGYTHKELDATVVALVVSETDASGQTHKVSVDSITNGQAAQVILDRTPFYAEMGGQVGDTGLITTSTTPSTTTLATPATPITSPTPPAPATVFTVTDTRVFEKAVYAHEGSIDGTLRVGDAVHAHIDTMRRERTERNHTATHLLHYALQQILGEHVKQAGSLVAPDHLRFDFTHFEPLTAAQLREIEEQVNILIMEDGTVSSYETSLDEARDSGVTALFGEKYGERVRVLEAGPASRELCGGTHVTHTAQIGFLKITGESSVGASLRRIEAVTSFDALQHVNRMEAELRKAAAALKSGPLEVADKAVATLARIRELEDTLAAGRKAAAAGSVQVLLDGALDVAGYTLVVARLDGLDVEGLRGAWDELRGKLGSAAAVVLGSITPAGSPLLLAAGTQPAVDAGFNAGAVIKQAAPLIKGGGGGKPTMAQAGGKDVSALDDALALARSQYA